MEINKITANKIAKKQYNSCKSEKKYIRNSV